jgi:hypothetical protein
MTRKLRLLALLSLLAAGCATSGGGSVSLFSTTVTKEQYANLTAGAVGCPANEITISGEKRSFGIGDQVTPWTAECRGHRFVCGVVGRATASCREELQAVQAPAPAPAAAPVQAAHAVQ